ncbi:hypothetical protein RHS01_00589 [Rhizoctonia solani]|uniref:Uncharacterized protein n=1 Tax=Rhizoctonia solani TaxID=456999 RepID=A0A8H7IP53_9AGAM|nr:hypothetical protein RHS01_00589 [Rhizoctonia solani]
MTCSMSPCSRRHATSYDLHASSVEKWDVLVWNNQVNSSHNQDLATDSSAHRHAQSSLPMSGTPRAHVPNEEIGSFAAGTPQLSSLLVPTSLVLLPVHRPLASDPRPLAPAQSPVVNPLSTLHRSVEQHDADFLARMRELEQRCHLLPDSLTALRSEDLSCTTRGRKRDIASWDEDNDVEMSSWNERRRKHLSWGGSSGLFGSSLPTCDSDKTSVHSFDDEYVPPTAAVDADSGSSLGDDEDDELDIVIVPGGSDHSLGSTPPSLSTSLSSLPIHSGPQSHPINPYTPLSCIPTNKKGVEELTAAMHGGAGSIVEWSVSSDVSADEARYISAENAQAGALWA